MDNALDGAPGWEFKPGQYTGLLRRGHYGNE
jgi:hypothetical protein